MSLISKNYYCEICEAESKDTHECIECGETISYYQCKENNGLCKDCL